MAACFAFVNADELRPDVRIVSFFTDGLETVLFFVSEKIYTFDSISDPINSEDLLNQIKKDKSFITGYSFKQGERNPEGLFYNFSKESNLTTVENWLFTLTKSLSCLSREL